MAASEVYQQQVALLVQTLPTVAEEPSLALKGGTAINFFFRDLPRLSVDIDLAYLPVEGRAASLAGIDAAMKRIAQRIRNDLPGARVAEGELRPEGIVNKLVVRVGGVQIKIEVTPVLRGCVFEPQLMPVSPAVEETFGYAETTVVSFDDLFAGKMVAALDRQHPRDLFNVRDLLANEGLTDPLRTAFVVYLISHNRPAAEVLAPRRRDIEAEFYTRFAGMTETPVTLDELLATREALVEQAVGAMPEAHRRFPVSFERGEYDWDALGVDKIDQLPAVRWKLDNLAKLSAPQRGSQAEALAKIWNEGDDHGLGRTERE
jgi:predicted nucleotidyltransferase component of viral defense system